MSHSTEAHRIPPPRRFENYILTRIVDSSAGLTAIPDTFFTQAPGSAGLGSTDDAYTDPPVDIGFPFQIDGITYKKVAICTNGWVALVDPVLGTFNSNQVLDSAIWINQSIKATFLANHVLLCPWFDDLRNVANIPDNLAFSPFNYSATKISRINAGLEPPPVFYSPTSFGCSYYLDQRSPQGRRLIIRWASVSNFSTPSSVVRFECVLYENGTIEFRYTPRTALNSNSAFESATIGVFMPGSANRFRDFSVGLGYRENSRQEYIYGGYVYETDRLGTPIYLDNSVPYTNSLLPSRHWPGQAAAGSILRFTPPKNRRKILPRKLSSERDSRPSYPSARRTGTANKAIVFRVYDDRKSPEYSTNITTTPEAPAAALDGLQWEIPRVSDASATVYNVVDPAPIGVNLPGLSGTIYNVSLRFRGVVEQKTYTGGSNNGAYFQIGGAPAGDAWNTYTLHISDPPQTYYLNKGTSNQFLVFLIDYNVTIPIAAGARVSMTASSNGGQMIANNVNTGGPLSVPGITDPVQPFAGQFIQMNFLGSAISSSTSPFATNQITTTQVNYPTTLPRFFGGNGLGTSERQDLFAGDFLVTSSVVKSAIDQYVDEAPAEYIEPFTEISRPDQSPGAMENSFFTTGSTADRLPSGFDQNLRSKTQIRFTLPVSTKVTMPAVTASIYYYNARARAWEVPQASTYVVANAGSTPPGGTTTGDWANPIASVNNGRIIEDARGFGPVGNIVSSGSGTPTGNQQTDPALGAPYLNTTAASIIGKNYDKSVRNNQSYQAVGDETFTIPINTPFLIEKAVFEIPISAGPGWFADKTKCFLPLVGGTTFDFAGPALTVALFRQVMLSERAERSVRDLILTGTITHAGDNVKQLEITSFSPHSATFQVRPVGFLAYAGPAGAVVNPRSDNTFTGSIEVQAEAMSAAGIGVRYVRNFTGTNAQNRADVTTLARNTTTLVLSSTLNISATVGYVSPLGRGGTGFDQAGRVTLGNEFVTFQGLQDQTGRTFPNPFLTASLTAEQQALLAPGAAGAFVAQAVAVIPVVSHFAAPYLVMPGDRLVLSISKMRPHMYGNGQTIPANSGTLTHDINLQPGNVNVTLYGSLIQEGEEFHDPLNQPIGSDVVHELIGAEPVLDQFELAYRNEYTGSYTDIVMLGRLTPNSTRDRKLSRLNARNVLPLTTSSADTSITPSKAFRAQPWYEKVPDVRHVPYFDPTERFWDSMMPGIADAFKADGTGIFVTPGGTFGDFRQVDVSPTGSVSIYNPRKTSTGWALLDDKDPNLGSLYNPIINGNWNRSFPFEPRYQRVSRQLDIARSLIATYIYQPFSFPVVAAITPTIVNGLVFGTVGLGTTILNYSGFFPFIQYTPNQPVYEWFSDSNLSSRVNNVHYVTAQSPSLMYPTASMVTDDTSRVLFGFGDKNTIYYTSFGGAGVMLGTNHFPESRDVEGPHPDGFWTYYDISNFRYSPVIRGWKYGVYSGIPAFSKAYYRRGAFGQFRDMLEQRPYSKYYQSPENSSNVPNFQQGVQPAPVTVTFLDPNSGRLTAPDNTWSSNLHFECTSSIPFFDGLITNRTAIKASTLNLHPNVVRRDRFGNIRLG